MFADSFRSLLNKSPHQTFDILQHSTSVCRSLSGFSLPASAGLVRRPILLCQDIISDEIAVAASNYHLGLWAEAAQWHSRARSSGPNWLLGPRRPSGAFALYDCVHAGGDVIEGGETMRANVLSDITRTAIVMQILLRLIVFILQVAFWPSLFLDMLMSCHSIPYLHISMLCQFLSKFIHRIALPRFFREPLQRRIPRKARFVGKSRVKNHRRHRRSTVRTRFFAGKMLFWTIRIVCLWYFHLSWFITSHQRNRTMRSVNGNGPKGSKKGKGGKAPKGAIVPLDHPEPSHEDIVQQVISSLPEAALMRQQPQLDPNEWSTRVAIGRFWIPVEGFPFVQSYI